jgi:hypothetical protein
MRTIGPLLVLSIAISTAGVSRATTVHRCIGEHGEIAFSETRCAGGREIAGSSDGEPTSRAPAAARGAAEPRSTTSPMCPASPDALRDRIAEAFARRDANTLAGVLRWDGISGGAANSRMRDLADLTGRPLIGIDLGGDAIEADVGDAPPPAPTTLVTVRTGGLGGGASEREFRMTASGGCYWLDW